MYDVKKYNVKMYINSGPFLVPCLTSTYTLESNEFEKSNTITEYMTATYRQMIQLTVPNNTDTYSVVLNFESTDVTLSEEIQLTTLPDFISAVGGNLGLFIGFSCLPVLLKATEFLRQLKLQNVCSNTRRN